MLRNARRIEVGEEVKVYRNLHSGKISVQAKTPRGFRVVAHVDEIHLTGCEFIVNENGRQKVLRERSKNVHAMVLGRVSEAFELNRPIRVSYNPYKASQFVIGSFETGHKIYYSTVAIVKATGEIYV